MTSIMNIPASYHYEYKEEHRVYYVYYEGKYIGYAYHMQGIIECAEEHSFIND